MSRPLVGPRRAKWVWDVTDVKVTKADNVIGPFSLDDLKFGIQ
jgi:hypothetical protein